MLSRILLCLATASLVLSGCSTPYKKKDEVEAKERSGELIKDQSGDTSFQAFLGRLRTAVAKRDRITLTTMMVLNPTRGHQWRQPHGHDLPAVGLPARGSPRSELELLTADGG